MAGNMQPTVVDVPPPPEPKPATPHLGSEEERIRKITEAADELKRKLSAVPNEPDVWCNDAEDDAMDFSSEAEYTPSISSRGIPELKHDPPELNLTLNDLRDIGRVDHDHGSKQPRDVPDNASSSSFEDSEVTILDYNPVQTMIEIDLWSDDNYMEFEDGVADSGTIERSGTATTTPDAFQDSSQDRTENYDTLSSTNSIGDENTSQARVPSEDSRDFSKNDVVEEESTAEGESERRTEGSSDEKRLYTFDEKIQDTIIDDDLISKSNSRMEKVTREEDKEFLLEDNVNCIESDKVEPRESKEGSRETLRIGENNDEASEAEPSRNENSEDSRTEVNDSRENKRTTGSREECAIMEKIVSQVDRANEVRNSASAIRGDNTMEINESMLNGSERAGESSPDGATLTNDSRAREEKSEPAIVVKKTKASVKQMRIAIDEDSARDVASLEARQEATVESRFVNRSSLSSDNEKSKAHEQQQTNAITKSAHSASISEDRQERKEKNITHEARKEERKREDSSRDSGESDSRKRHEQPAESFGRSRSKCNPNGKTEARDKTEQPRRLDPATDTDTIDDNHKKPTSDSGTPTSERKIDQQKLPISDGKKIADELSSDGCTPIGEKKIEQKLTISDSKKIVDKLSSDGGTATGEKKIDQQKLPISDSKKICERRKLVRTMPDVKAFPRNRKSAVGDCTLESSVNFDKGERPVVFDPRGPPPAMIPYTTNTVRTSDTTCQETGINSQIPPAFDPRLSSRERSALLTSAPLAPSSIPIAQDPFVSQAYPACQIGNFVPSVTSINYGAPPPTIIGAPIEPPICLPDPYAPLLPLATMSATIPLPVEAPIMLQPPPPPPPPVKSGLDMVDELEDMHEAMEFAKTFMNMNDVDNIDDDSADSDFFHMPTFPDLPPIELPPLPPPDVPPPSAIPPPLELPPKPSNGSEKVDSPARRSVSNSDCKKDRKSAKDELTIKQESIEARGAIGAEKIDSPARRSVSNNDSKKDRKSAKDESTMRQESIEARGAIGSEKIDSPARRSVSNNDSKKDRKPANDGPTIKQEPIEAEGAIGKADDLVDEDPPPLSDDCIRPKVIFNLASKSPKLSKPEVWQQHDHPKNKPVSSPIGPISTAKDRTRSVNGHDDREKSRADQKTSRHNGVVGSSKKPEEPTKIHCRSRSPSPSKKVSKDENSRSTPTDHERNESSRRKDAQDANSKKSAETTTPESTWKSRVIGRFLKMSKNDIRNMLNNTSLRKFDIAMKHLVKERRSSLSLGVRNTDDEKSKTTGASYNREEFMDQLSAMLDPSATVDFCNLPTQFIHHLSEVLQLDSVSDFESALKSTAEPTERKSSPCAVQRTAPSSARRVPRATPPSANVKEIDDRRPTGKGRENKSMSTANVATTSVASVQAVTRRPSSRAHDDSVDSRCPNATDTIAESTNANRGTGSSRLTARARRGRPGVGQSRSPTISSNGMSARNPDRDAVNMADLDDIFTAGIAREKKKLSSVVATRCDKRSIDSGCSSFAGHNEAARDPSVDRVERAAVELDKIFTAGIARFKQPSIKAAATRPAEANDGDEDDEDGGWHRDERKSNADDAARCHQRSVYRVSSRSDQQWTRRKPYEDRDSFRNLTKEEWEAKYGGESSYVSYEQEYRAMVAMRARRSEFEALQESESVTGVRARLGHEVRPEGAREAWSDGDEAARYRNADEPVGYDVNAQGGVSGDSSSSSSMSTSSSSSDDEHEAVPSVTKLLKVIKAKEKIAKKRSINEEIRDEVTAEIERKRRERGKVHKSRHKSRLKKSHRRRKDRKEKVKERKKKGRKRRRKRSRRSGSESRESSEEEDEEDEESEGASSRLLTESEIKKEIVIKDEPETESITPAHVPVRSKSSLAIRLNDEPRPPSTSSASSLPAMAISSSQPKTKAQLKQMPAAVRKVPSAPVVSKETAKIEGLPVSEAKVVAVTAAIVEASPAVVETVKSTSAPSSTPAGSAGQIQPASSAGDEVHSTLKTNSKKLDIKTYKERARQRQIRETEKLRQINENPSVVTQDLVNVSIDRTNIVESIGDAAGPAVAATISNSAVISASPRTVVSRKTSPPAVAAVSSARKTIATSASPRKVVSTLTSSGTSISTSTSSGTSVATSTSSGTSTSTSTSSGTSISTLSSSGTSTSTSTSSGTSISTSTSHGTSVSTSAASGTSISTSTSSGTSMSTSTSHVTSISTSPSPGKSVSTAPTPGKSVSNLPTPGKSVSNSPTPGKLVSTSTTPGKLVSTSTTLGKLVSSSTTPGKSISTSTPPGKSISTSTTPGKSISTSLSSLPPSSTVETTKPDSNSSQPLSSKSAPPKKLVRRRSVTTAPKVEAESTALEARAEAGKFAHIKSEGSKEMKLREKLKKPRSRAPLEGLESTIPTSKPARVRKRGSASSGINTDEGATVSLEKDKLEEQSKEEEKNKEGKNKEEDKHKDGRNKEEKNKEARNKEEEKNKEARNKEEEKNKEARNKEEEKDKEGRNKEDEKNTEEQVTIPLERDKEEQSIVASEKLVDEPSTVSSEKRTEEQATAPSEKLEIRQTTITTDEQVTVSSKNIPEEGSTPLSENALIELPTVASEKLVEEQSTVSPKDNSEDQPTISPEKAVKEQTINSQTLSTEQSTTPSENHPEFNTASASDQTIVEPEFSSKAVTQKNSTKNQSEKSEVFQSENLSEESTPISSKEPTKELATAAEDKIEALETPRSNPNYFDLFRKGPKSDSLPDTVPLESIPTVQVPEKLDDILVQQSDLHSLPMPITDLPGWSITPNVGNELNDSSEDPPFRGFTKDTIILRDRVLTDTEGNISEIDDLGRVPLDFEDGADERAVGVLDLDDVTSTGVSLEAPLSYGDDEFVEDGVAIETSLLGFPVENEMTDEPETIAIGTENDLVSHDFDKSAGKSFDEESSHETMMTPSLNDSPAPDDFLIADVQRPESIPSPLLVSERTGDELAKESTGLSSNDNVDEPANENRLESEINAAEVGTSREFDNTGESRIDENKETAIAASPDEPQQRERMDTPNSALTVDDGISPRSESEIQTDSYLEEDKSSGRPESQESQLEKPVVEEAVEETIVEAKDCPASESAKIDSTIDPVRQTAPGDDVKEENKEVTDEKPITVEENRQVVSNKTAESHRGAKSKDHGRVKGKSSRHRNHASKIDKKSALTEKMVEEAVAANIVKVVPKPSSKESVLARMIEIDVEIHKLMNEKMTLYTMLQSGEFPAKDGVSEAACERNNDDSPTVADREETISDIAPPTVLASHLVRNFDKSVLMTPSIVQEQKKIGSDVNGKTRKRKKSPQREPKSQARDVEVAETRRERKNSESKSHSRGTTSEDSSRQESASTHSREKSTSSTELEDGSENRRKRKTKLKDSSNRQSGRRARGDSSKEDLREASLENVDRSLKSTRRDPSPKMEKTKRKTKSSADTKKTDESSRARKPVEEKSSTVSRPTDKIGSVIYSDESTWDSLEPDAVQSDEQRSKKDGATGGCTGLALLEESFKREIAQTRKLKAVQRRKNKDQELRRVILNPTALTPDEEETPLSDLYERKNPQKKENRSAKTARGKSTGSNEDPVRVWKHITSVIDAVASDRVEQLYAGDRSSISRGSTPPKSFQSGDNEIERERSPSISPPESTVSDTAEPLKRSRSEDSESVQRRDGDSRDCDHVEPDETSSSRASKKSKDVDEDHPSESRESETGDTTSTSERSSSVDDSTKRSREEDTSSGKSTPGASDNDIVAERNSTPRPGDTPVAKEENDKEELSASVVESSKKNSSASAQDREDETKTADVSLSAAPSSTSSTTIKSVENKEIKVEPKEKLKDEPKEKLKDESKDKLKDESKDKLKDQSKDKLKDESKDKLKDQSKDKLKDESKERLKDEAKDKPKDDHPKSTKEKTPVRRSSKDREHARSRSHSRGDRPSKRRSETPRELERERERKSSSRADDGHDREDKRSGRPKSATKRKQREKSNPPNRRNSRYSEDRSKRSRSKKRDRERSDSRGGSPHGSEPSRKRPHRSHRSSSPKSHTTSADDQARRRGRKRKRRAEMTREEMMNCKVQLIDCKYTYLSPDMHPRVLKKFGISRINPYVPPVLVAESSSPSEIARAETPPPPTLTKVETPDEIVVEEPTEESSKDVDGPEKVENERERDDEDVVYEAEDEDGVDETIQIVKVVEDMQNPTMSDQDEEGEASAPEIIDETSCPGDTDPHDVIAVEDETNDGLEIKNDANDEVEVLEEKRSAKSADKPNEKSQPSPGSEPEDDIDYETRTRYTVHKGPILDIKVLDDSFLAASEDGAIYRYSQTSNGILNIYKGHEAAVTCIYVLEMPAKRWNLYSGSLDGTFRCYDITTGVQERPPADVGSPVQCMDQAWGVIFVGTKSGHISRYNIKSGSIKGDRLEFSDKSVLALKASAEGPRRVLIVASRNQPITIRDALTGLFLRTICGYKSHTVYSLMRERNLVYCGTSSTSIPVFDFTNGEQVTQYNAGVGIVCMRLYRQILFAGCYDGNIYVFDTKEPKLIVSIPGPGNMLLSMEVIGDEIIAGSKNRQLHSWRMPKKVRALLSERT